MASEGIRNLVLLLGDQLTRGISALQGFDPERDRILMAELAEETSYVPHHVQKIVLVLSAMRHFAEELRNEGLPLDYVALEDDGNSGSFTGELARAVKRLDPERIIVTEPGEWRLREVMEGWTERFARPVEIRPDTRFFASRERFASWAKGRRSFRMEHFYREMRRETGILMEGETPSGGRWNFDAENRKALPKGERVPRRHRVEPDAVTRAVIDMVRRRFPDNFGDLDGFGWAVTRKDALDALDRFVAELLPRFGDYQDAMKRGAPFLFHAVLSPYLNIGLLTAGEVCTAAETAWRDGRAPLNAVEGFVRQILGWREYVRGVYWLRMPDYPESNVLGADRPLPDFYWTGETDMACMAEAVAATRRHAYAHHIQRLMVTGNFALLAGIRPAEVEAWYLVVYADAFEWVELPNVHGMALFADGGLLASKPYAASGAYIDRMSDYCAGCAYDPRAKTGAKACPFNVLYWRFLSVNRDRLAGNPRMAMPYRTLDAMEAGQRAEVLRAAEAWLEKLDAAGSTYAAPRQAEQGDLFG
ncbi:cryptochrome/photolyase family protein [Kaistia geumhonensis]|uniref:Deoxyribodipyrimidine photolyase-related protein n=1 Tax=Kaistia geumhonensis TaxID=410839 RepID=A0ABU0M791_9HYPH|nr:cryptochrome/photolyase family protein [Kaistia geumhonensis]MDQ0516816.1 deoxyribodipyrimidine photolyase-related protein [Kaistia geumhonensis]